MRYTINIANITFEPRRIVHVVGGGKPVSLSKVIIKPDIKMIMTDKSTISL
jgi:hypothetical protein